jgi:hypothetical protein
VSRRASLPGAEELFRRTAPQRDRLSREGAVGDEETTSPQEDKSTAQPEDKSTGRRRKHDEKITFYCTSEDVMALERARLALRGRHRVAADRGRIVRAALAYVLEDFEARGEDSILVHELGRG